MILFQGVYTYTGHVGQPDWKRADRRDCLQCRCIHRPCADPRSQWRGRASVASPLLKEEKKRNRGHPQRKPHEKCNSIRSGGEGRSIKSRRSPRNDRANYEESTCGQVTVMSAGRHPATLAPRYHPTTETTNRATMHRTLPDSLNVAGRVSIIFNNKGGARRGGKYNFFDFPFLWKLFKVSFTTVFIYFFLVLCCSLWF